MNATENWHQRVQAMRAKYPALVDDFISKQHRRAAAHQRVIAARTALAAAERELAATTKALAVAEAALPAEAQAVLQ